MIIEIGNNKVALGNIMDGITELMGNDMADIFYTDPPRGKGTMNYWITLNKKNNDGVSIKDVEYLDFINKIFETIVKYAKNIIFFEYGRNRRQEIQNKAKEYGLICHGVAEPLYRSGSKKLPMDLHIFSKSGANIDNELLNSISGTLDLETIRNAVNRFIVPGGIRLDPMCGLGLGAKIALENGMVFRGNEFNKKRLQKTIDFLTSNQNNGRNK